jgi:hypothetical protein
MSKSTPINGLFDSYRQTEKEIKRISYHDLQIQMTLCLIRLHIGTQTCVEPQ